MDIVLAGSTLLVLLPLLLLIALAIRLDSTGPALYPHTRLGRRGRPFTMYKFRSMCPDAEHLKKHLQHLNTLKGPVFKLPDDPRITRIGRLLRRTSLDELPQLLNVVRGDMSLVGPRPPLPAEAATYATWHWRRMDVIPGLTGLWQISGRASEPDFDRWVAWDLRYIDEWSLGLDLRIMLYTIPAVLRGHGAY
ncbi:MAG: sugar transferase [Candidatus Sericytochromatia bacterium]|nr:sugar transferase [Candidatus Sericytochromatia bacterium]